MEIRKSLICKASPINTGNQIRCPVINLTRIQKKKKRGFGTEFYNILTILHHALKQLIIEGFPPFLTRREGQFRELNDPHRSVL